MSQKRQITLAIPKQFQIPPIYLESGEEQIALALTLGAEAVSYMNRQAATALQTDSQEQAVKEATREFERTSAALQTRLKRPRRLHAPRICV